MLWLDERAAASRANMEMPWWWKDLLKRLNMVGDGKSLSRDKKRTRRGVRGGKK